MKVKELLKLLEKANPDLEVSIVADRGHTSIGPCSHTGVSHAGAGFDWDSGLFLLRPEEKLAVEDKTTEVAKRYYRRSVDFYMMAETGSFNKNQISRELKRFLELSFDEVKEK